MYNYPRKSILALLCSDRSVRFCSVLFGSQSVDHFFWQSMYQSIYVSTCLLRCHSSFRPFVGPCVVLFVCQAVLLSYHLYAHTYCILTYIHPCMHAYCHTHLLRCIQTYIHTCTTLHDTAAQRMASHCNTLHITCLYTHTYTNACRYVCIHTHMPTQHTAALY